MHGSATFLQDLAAIMITAGLVTVVFHRLRQPVVLGYIVAGVIIGPHTPPFQLIVNEHNAVETLAEIGIIMLMFGLGLHFSLSKLASVGLTALLGATLEILLMVLIGYQIGQIFGWSKMDSIFLGAILSISSTTIIVKALGDLGRMKEKFSELIFGILIVEDILAIAMIALLSSIGRTGSLAVGEVVTTLLELMVFLAVVLVVGLLAVPPLLRYVARFRSNEMLLITTLALCFGVSLAALKMEYSVALGAFLIGAIIAEAREAGKVDGLIESVRDMFSAIFFVSVGLMIDPRMMITYWLPIAVITVAVIVGKVIACGTGTFLAGHDARTSLHVGMGVSQIGEFSFIIAQLGLTLGVTGEHLYPIAVAVSAITTLSTPYLIQVSDPLVALLERHGPRSVGGYFDTYSGWITRLKAGERSGSYQIRRLLWKWAAQIALNVTLLTGLFIVAVWFARRADRWLPVAPWYIGGTRGLVWLGALLLALPLLVASFRKVRAAAMVLAEMGVPRQATRQQTDALRALVANTVVLAACTAIVMWVLLLSSTILPPWPVLVAFGVLIVIVTVLSWSHLVRVYAKAQIAIRETLTTDYAREGAIAAVSPAAHLSPMLKDAVLETITVAADSAGAGKLIRELALRTRTGASIVGIERNGAAMVNPGPDEELLVGDRVLLIGTHEQLGAAREALKEAPSA